MNGKDGNSSRKSGKNKRGSAKRRDNRRNNLAKSNMTNNITTSRSFDHDSTSATAESQTRPHSTHSHDDPALDAAKCAAEQYSRQHSADRPASSQNENLNVNKDTFKKSYSAGSREKSPHSATSAQLHQEQQQSTSSGQSQQDLPQAPELPRTPRAPKAMREQEQAQARPEMRSNGLQLQSPNQSRESRKQTLQTRENLKLPKIDPTISTSTPREQPNTPTLSHSYNVQHQQQQQQQQKQQEQPSHQALRQSQPQPQAQVRTQAQARAPARTQTANSAFELKSDANGHVQQKDPSQIVRQPSHNTKHINSDKKHAESTPQRDVHTAHTTVIPSRQPAEPTRLSTVLKKSGAQAGAAQGAASAEKPQSNVANYEANNPNDAPWKELAPQPVEAANHIEKLVAGQKDESKKNWLNWIDRILKKTQKYSSYGFVGFVGLHFASVGVASLVSYASTGGKSLEVAEDSLELARALYRGSAAIEALVLGSAAVHISSGVGVRLLRTGRQVHDYGWQRLKEIRINPISRTGYWLTPLASLHFMVARFLPMQSERSVSLMKMHTVFLEKPIVFLIINGTLVIVATTHVVYGLGKYFRWKRSMTNITWATTCALWLGGLLSIAAIRPASVAY